MPSRNPEFICTVIIALTGDSLLEISTSASHALQIISGETILPFQNAKVIGLDGRPLTKADLLRLRQLES